MVGFAKFFHFVNVNIASDVQSVEICNIFQTGIKALRLAIDWFSYLFLIVDESEDWFVVIFLIVDEIDWFGFLFLVFGVHHFVMYEKSVV